MEKPSLQPTIIWAERFAVDDDDVDFLVNYLLEKETPLTSRQLAQLLVERRLEAELQALEDQYKEARLYSPAESYEVGTQVIFPALEFAKATVTDVRDGENPDYGAFKVMRVDFGTGQAREFAAEYPLPHKLSEEAEVGMAGLVGNDFTTDDVLRDADDIILEAVEDALEANDTLIRLAKQWFPRDLVLDVDVAHLHLAEAVLDMAGGGPLTPEEIVEQIGGISDSSPLSLQVFSLNGALNQDSRFDEVGPTGQVLWYLVSMEPEDVRSVPPLLRHQPIDYDATALNDDAKALEREIADELSSFPVQRGITEGRITLIYPHRRAGTLPLNGNIRTLFPYAQRTSTIYITLVDGTDGEEFTGWVVPGSRYITGLLPIYNKHSIPIGAYVRVLKADTPDRVVINFDIHRDRTEWLPLFIPKGDQITFENTRRGIGADFDPLMILGLDDLKAVDELVAKLNENRRPLAALIRTIIPELGRLTPLATAHAKTIYSAVNVVRRCPPGPILATLANNPDFVDAGGNFWQLAES